MTTVWIAEKPSAAKTIADALARTSRSSVQRNDGYFKVGDNAVTFARGHLFELAQAHDYDSSWKTWSLKPLPLIPQSFISFPRKGSGIPAQIRTIKGLLKSARSVVNAGDAAREGQLIIDNVIRESGIDPFSSKVQRLWLSSYADQDVDRAIAGIKPNAERKALSAAATTRSHADWLHGINMTRLFTLLSQQAGGNETVRVGRVKTPTLGLVVTRDREIENFRATDHYGLAATFQHLNGSFTAEWQFPQDLELDPDGRLLDRKVAADVAERIKGKEGQIVSTDSQRKSKAAPLPFNLSALQTEMSRRFGFSAQRTLDVAQSLYEKKLATYPRTDCRYLPTAIHTDEAKIILDTLASVGSYSSYMEKVEPRQRSSAWNDKKVSDHHAIIPTRFNAADLDLLTDDEKRLFDIIAKSFLGLFLPDQKWLATVVFVRVEDQNFKATGRVPLEAGWTILRGVERDDEAESSIPEMNARDRVDVTENEVKSKRTTPPSPYTDGTLIEAMASAAKFVKDPEIKRRLREVGGIGTEATRAGLLEELLRDSSLRKERGKGKAQYIRSTPKGRDVIDAVNGTAPSYTSVELTALWESRLSKIAAGDESMDAFMSDLADTLRRTVTEAREKGGVKVGEGMKTLDGDGKTCPECGVGTMRTRKARKSGKLFLGCDNWSKYNPNFCSHSEWPDDGSATGSSAGARHAVASHPKEGTDCPKCGNGKLRLRHSKKTGNPFLACDSWKPDASDNCGHIENVDAPGRNAGGRRSSRKFKSKSKLTTAPTLRSGRR
ncbi:MAG: DNA topoisomerase 3 [Verrucomicrobiota bacterium]